MIAHISLFLILFDLAIPPVKFLGGAPFAFLLMLFPLVTQAYGFNKFFGIAFEYRYVGAIFVSIMLWSLIRTIFSVDVQVEFFLSIGKTFVIFISCALYLSIYGVHDLDRKIINLYFLNAIICLVAGSNEVLLEMVYLFKPEGSLRSWLVYRNSFLSGVGYFGIATGYSIVIVFMTHLIITKKQNLLFYLKFSLILLVGVLAARTTFIGITFALLYTLFKRPSHGIFFVVVLLLMILIIFNVEALSIYSDWIFELFVTNSNNLYETSSTNHLLSMYKLPENFMSILFGDGLYVAENGGYYMHSDVGYVRHMFFGGVVLVFLMLIFIFTLGIQSRSLFFMFVICPLCIVFHLKGAFILHNRIGMSLLFFLSFWFYRNSLNNKLLRGYSFENRFFNKFIE